MKIKRNYMALYANSKGEPVGFKVFRDVTFLEAVNMGMTFTEPDVPAPVKPVRDTFLTRWGSYNGTGYSHAMEKYRKEAVAVQLANDKRKAELIEVKRWMC